MYLIIRGYDKKTVRGFSQTVLKTPEDMVHATALNEWD